MTERPPAFKDSGVTVEEYTTILEEYRESVVRTVGVFAVTDFFPSDVKPHATRSISADIE